MKKSPSLLACVGCAVRTTAALGAHSAPYDLRNPVLTGQRASVRRLAEQQLEAEADQRRSLARLVARLAGPGVAADQLAVEPLAVERPAVHGADAVLAQRHLVVRRAADEGLPGDRRPRAEVLVEHRRRAPVDAVGGLGDGAHRSPVKEQLLPPQHVVVVGAGRRAETVAVLVEDGLPQAPDRPLA